MFFRSPLRRRPLSPITAVQALESRALLAAAPVSTAPPLAINGTAGGDLVMVIIYPSTTQTATTTPPTTPPKS